MRASPAARVVALAVMIVAAAILGAAGHEHPAGAGTGSTGSNLGLVVTPTPADFGNVNVGATATNKLTLTNTNTIGLVTISAPLGKPATTDCNAFTVTPMPALPDVILAGGTRQWPISFKPTAPGPYDCQWVLNDDDGNTDYIHLTGTGVTGKLSIAPDPVDFGTQPLNASVDQTVTLSDAGSGSLTISAIKQTSGNPPFTILNLPALPVTLFPTQATTFTVRFHPTAAGAFSGAVQITSDDLTSTSSILPLAGMGGGSAGGATITLSPSPVDFGSNSVGATGSAQLAVGNTGAGSLDVTAMAISGTNATDFAFADASLGCTSGQSCGTPFSVGPSAPPRSVGLACRPAAAGLRLATLTVSSNATGGTSSVTLQCTGTAPQVATSPQSMSFGTIRVNTTSSQTLFIQNNGNADLVVSALTLDGSNPGDFAVQSCATGCTVPASTSVGVGVTFTPPVRGIRTANLHVLSNAPGQADVVVPLDGAGGLPVLVITQPSTGAIDFGGIPVNTTSSAAPITVQNQGELTLDITGVSSMAPFALSGTLPPPTIALPPSQSATWYATCAPTAATPYSGAAAITSDDPANPNQSVSLSCTGINSNVVAVPSPLAFGTVRTGAMTTQTIKFENDGAAAVTINSLSLTPAGTAFTAAVTGTLPRTLAHLDQLAVDVTFAPVADGHQTASLSLVDNTGATAATVALSGDGATAAYTVAPTAVDLGRRCVSQSDSADVTITNTGTAHVMLTGSSIVGGGGAFSIANGNVGSPIDLAPTQAHVVSVVGVAASGTLTASLQLTTDVAGAPMTTVPLMIEGTAAGVVANPTFVDFMTQPIGVTTAPTTVTLTNCSSAPLTVSSARIAGADADAFALTGTTPATLTIGANQAWMVTFTAKRAGAHSAQLELVNDGATSPIVIALSGSGATASGGDGGVDAPPGGNGASTTSYYACACRTGGAPGAGAIAPLALALGLALRRRRRRRAA